MELLNDPDRRVRATAIKLVEMTGNIEAMKQVRPVWNVNALAQTAGVAALKDDRHLQRSLNALSQAKSDLVADLVSVGFSPANSQVHYFIMWVDDGASFRQGLLQYGVLVRDCASFGLPGYVRIAARRPEENRRLLTAIEKLRAGGA